MMNSVGINVFVSTSAAHPLGNHRGLILRGSLGHAYEPQTSVKVRHDELRFCVPCHGDDLHRMNCCTLKFLVFKISFINLKNNLF